MKTQTNNDGTLFDSDLKPYWQIVSGLLFVALLYTGSWAVAIDSSNYYLKADNERLRADSVRVAQLPVVKEKPAKMGHCTLSGIIENEN